MTDAFDLLEKELDRAAQTFQRKAIGKGDIKAKFLKWNNPGTSEAPVEVDQETYLSLDEKHRGVKYVIMVDVQEFAPHLQFSYRKEIEPGKADWNKTFAPSVEAICGQGSMVKAESGKTLRGLLGKYWEVTDVPQQPKKNNKHINQATGEPYTTPTITKVFASREEAYQSHVALFGEHKEGDNGNGNGNAPAMTPSGGLTTWSPSEWKNQWGDILDTYLADPTEECIARLAGDYVEDASQVVTAIVRQYWTNNPGTKAPQIASALKMKVPTVSKVLANADEIPF